MSIGVWQVIVLLGGIVVGIIAFAALAIETERSAKCTDRFHFIGWVVALIIVKLTMSVNAMYGDSLSAVGLYVAFLVFGFLFLRSIVRRARDAGRSKRLAYLAIVPLLNFGLIAYLLFKKGTRLPKSA